MAKSPESFPHDNPDEDLISEPIELDGPEVVVPNTEVEQRQPKKEIWTSEETDPKNRAPSTFDLLQEARKNLETAQKKVPDWVKETQKKNVEKFQDEIRELEHRLGREMLLGGDYCDHIMITVAKDIEFDKTKSSEAKERTLSQRQLQRMHEGFSRLPITIIGPHHHDAIVRFLNVEGSSKKDLIIVLGPEEGRKIAIDDEKIDNLRTSMAKTQDLGDAKRTDFKPKEQLDFDGIQINEVRLFIGSKMPEELRPESKEKAKNLDTMDSPAFQKKTVDQIDDYLKRKRKLGEYGPDLYMAARALTGLDSDKAWEIRKNILNTKPDPRKLTYDRSVMESVTGLDSKKAWDIRGKWRKYDIVATLAGLDSDEAWKIRDEVMKECDDHYEYEDRRKPELAKSLIGLDSDRAWDTRYHLWSPYAQQSRCVAPSLVGLDSDRAWDMREDIIETKDKGAVEEIIGGLAGLDSDMAWKMRERLTAEAEDKHDITLAMLRGLAGVDSDRAWQLRDKYLSNPDYFIAIASSLSGLSSDRAQKMREKLVKEKYEESAIREIYGGIEMVGVRKARHDKIKKRNRK